MIQELRERYDVEYLGWLSEQDDYEIGELITFGERRIIFIRNPVNGTMLSGFKNYTQLLNLLNYL